MRIQDIEELAGQGLLDTCRAVGDAWRLQDDQMFSMGCMLGLTVAAVVLSDHTTVLSKVAAVVDNEAGPLIDQLASAGCTQASRTTEALAATLLGTFANLLEEVRRRAVVRARSQVVPDLDTGDSDENALGVRM